MSTTLLALTRSIARETQYIQVTPSATGTTTSIVANGASSELDSVDSAKLLVNGYAKVEADSAATPLNVGEVRRISDYTPANGTITVARAFSNATTTTMTIGLYLTVPPGTSFGLHKGILAYINDCLRQMRYRTPVLLTLAPDGDMEASGTTNYAAAVSSCTLAKTTTLATGVILGKQALSLGLSGASDGVKLASAMDVVEGQVYDIVVDLYKTSSSNTITLTAYDQTNSVAVKTVKTKERGQRYLYLQVTIPNDCYQLNVWITKSSTITTTYVDNLSIRRVYATEISLPSWWDDQTCKLEELYYVGGGTQEQDNDSFSVDDRRWYKVHRADVIEDRGGVTPYKVTWEGTNIPSGYHLVLQAIRPYAELSADTDTTDADAEAVENFALANIYADKGDKEKAVFFASKANARYKKPRFQGRAFQPLRGF